MITLFSGTPGSGKSLHIAQILYDRMRYGHSCICNFDIALDKIKKVHKDSYFRYVDNSELNPYLLRDIAQKYFLNHTFKEGKLLLVIDECQIIFNARDWRNGSRSDWLTFFTQHRKLGYDIILVAQFDGMIDKQMRALIEYNVMHRKVTNFGKVGFALSLFSAGQLFCAVKMWYPLNERIDSTFFRGKKRYYALYDTNMIFEDDKKLNLSVLE